MLRLLTAQTKLVSANIPSTFLKTSLLYYSAISLLSVITPYTASAQTCTPSTPTSGDVVSCNGDFSSGITMNVDGTLELGLDGPTKITATDEPGGFVYALTGDAKLTSAADVSTNGKPFVFPGPIGLLAWAQNGNATVQMIGGIIETPTNIGAAALSSNGNASIEILNGNITVSDRIAVAADSSNGNTFISNNADIFVNGGLYSQIAPGGATGISGFNNSVTSQSLSIINTGNITHNGFGAGIFSSASAATHTTVQSSGTLLIKGDIARGIMSSSAGDIDIIHSGIINTYGDGQSQGIIATTRSVGPVSTSGNINIINSGDITTRGDLLINPYPFFSFSAPVGIQANSITTARIENSGSITTFGKLASGISARSQNRSLIINTGDISIHGEASGISGSSPGLVEIRNSGTITTTNGIGIYADTYNSGDITIENTGTVMADFSENSPSLDEDEPEFNYAAIVATEDGPPSGNYSVRNTGVISASSIYGNGVFIYSTNGSASLVNTGAITSKEATAVIIQGATQQTVTNSGEITGAIGGVVFENNQNAYLNNSGTIRSSGGFAVKTGAGNDVIDNAGTIEGRIDLGIGNDTFNNSSPNTLILNGVSSFGAGDDVFNNDSSGSIIFNDGSILDFGAGSNSFINDGSISVNGTGRITLGSGNNFVNNGNLSLVNGTTNDNLIIDGNYTGGGALSIDVNPRLGQADALTITGNISGAPTVLNINYSELPKPGQQSISIPNLPFTSNQVALGQISGIAPVLDANLSVSNGNITLDYFTGLTSLGLTGSVLGIAAINSFNESTGLMRDRLGSFIFEPPKGNYVSWLNTSYFKGDQNPNAAIQNNNFEQKRKGIDFGFGRVFQGDQITGQFSFILGKGSSDIDLNKVRGSAELDSSLFGINGSVFFKQTYYVDALFQYASLEADIEDHLLQQQENDIDGSSIGLSLETGIYHIVESGLIIQPLVKISWLEVEWDSYQSGGLSYKPDDLQSLEGLVGVNLSKQYKFTNSAVTPSLALSIKHQFDGDASLNVSGYEFTTDNEATSYSVKTGLEVSFSQFSLSAILDWQNGGDLDNAFGGHLNLSYTF